MNRAFQNLPIKRKLMTVMMLTSSVALLLSCVGFVGYQLLSFIQNERQNLATLGDVIAANSTAALSFHDQSSAEETLRGLKAEPRILKACLYAKDGTVFATYTRDKNGQSCPPSVPRGGTANFEHTHLTLSRSVLLDGQNIGTLSLQADLAPEVLAYLRRAASILLFVMAASLLAALLVSRRLQHFISDPLRGLVASTQELAGGNLSVRVAAASTDEFGELARAFNEMAGSLQHSHAEILNYQQTLEQRVKDRTLELEKEIAERKQIETALSESESKFRVLIEQSADGFIVSDEQWNTRLANPAMCHMLGYTSEELCQLNISETYIPEERHLLARRRQEWRGGSIQHYERNMCKKDGSHFPVELSLSSVQTKGGWLAVGIFRDITERRRAEDALRQSEERFRSLAASATDAIIMIDGGGNVSFWNEAAEKVFGYSSQEVIGRDAHTLLAPPRYHEAIRKAFGHFRQTGEGTAIGKRLELVALRKDGTEFPMELSVSALKLQDEWMAIGILRDITDRRRTEAQMETLHKQLLEISRGAGMTEVATNVLHNVGNVLNSVNVSTALVSDKIRESRVSSLAKVVALMRAHQNDLPAFLTQDPKGMQLCDYLDNLAQYLGKEQTGMLKEIESLSANVEHIKEIVTMQQSYARAAGIVETLPIVDLVEDALRMNNGALARHEVQVVREYIAKPSVPVDKHKVLQILVNVVRNAKYALDDGGRKDKLLTVRVATDGDAFVTISVTDNGVGIPPENLTRIFSYGFTTRENGHGFGLHSGALAAKEMGASLSAHSDGPGQGATFTLSLPLHQEHENV